MAIYKPSNCAPFLSAQDLTQPFNISCELNTSNERVTGYKLKILDSLNNTIFEGKQFDPIDPITSGNTGLNGSVLTLPVVIDGDGTLNHNTIQYNKATKTYTVTTGNGEPEFHESLFKNGYPNQPYKWIITLAQGQRDNNNKFIQQPTDSKYFDMEITSGTVLGSTPNRIQSYLSENIQKDYFIQLYNELDDSVIGYRKLISSYDHTYGYIYPQENKFTKDDIKAAGYFQVYKFSNDPDVVSAGSKVVLVRATSMSEVKFREKTPKEIWGTGSETYPYYFTQKYTGFTEEPTNISGLSCDSFDTNASGTLKIGDTIIANGENEKKYNGLFTLQNIITKKEDDNTWTVTVQWLRAASADTWAELVNNVYLVMLGSYKNRRLQVQVGENETGTINETEIQFIPEKPIELYSDEKYGYGHKEEMVDGKLTTTQNGDKTKGQIFKNASQKTYIRPFEGILKGQKFLCSSDDWGNYKSSIITEVDIQIWQITSDIKETLTPDKDKYKITSFFKSSEENPFYAYADPTVEITSTFVTEEKGNKKYYKDSNGVLFYFDEGVAKDEKGKEIENPIFVIGNRFATLNGIFSQDNNKSWVYYQWRMTDLTIGTETTTEKGFDGEIAWTIYGLQNNHYYQVELYIQDEFGRVASKEITFQVQVEISEKKPFFEVEFDCETNSYKINTTSTGVVIPGLENKILKTKISEDKSFAVQEEQMEDFVATDKGEVYEFQVTDPFETIKDLVVDQGGNSDVHNYVLLKAKKNGNAIDNYNAGYNYNPDGSYSLYVTDLDKPATSSDNLFFYNKMKGDSGGESLIPAPKNDTITINFSNILNNYFEGQVMSYHIGVDSPSTAFNDIEVRVSVTPETVTLQGLKEVSPDRNKIKVEIYQCLKTTNENNTTEHKPKALIREKEFVFYGNPNPRKICSPWVNPARGAADSNCDYIETDVVYDKDGKKIEGGLNINGEGRYNSNSEISKPITLTESIKNPNTYAVWYDKTTELLNQADGSNINYFGDYWDYCDGTIYYKNINLKLDGNENNLWTFTSTTQKLDELSSSTPRILKPDIYYHSFSFLGASYGKVDGIVIKEKWFCFYSTGGYGLARAFKCVAGQKYTLSIEEQNGDVYILYHKEDGTRINYERLINISPDKYKNNTAEFITPEECTQFVIQFRSNDGVSVYNYWHDKTNSESPIYRQTSINLPDDSHTGEEIFTNKNLTFSLILSDYNTATKQFAPLEINGKLWNGDEEVPLTEITK